MDWICRLPRITKTLLFMTSVIPFLPLSFYFWLESLFSHLCCELADFQFQIHNIYLLHPGFFLIRSTKKLKPNQTKSTKKKNSLQMELFLLYESQTRAGSQLDSLVSNNTISNLLVVAYFHDICRNFIGIFLSVQHIQNYPKNSKLLWRMPKQVDKDHGAAILCP